MRPSRPCAWPITSASTCVRPPVRRAHGHPPAGPADRIRPPGVARSRRQLACPRTAAARPPAPESPPRSAPSWGTGSVERRVALEVAVSQISAPATQVLSLAPGRVALAVDDVAAAAGVHRLPQNQTIFSGTPLRFIARRCRIASWSVNSSLVPWVMSVDPRVLRAGRPAGGEILVAAGAQRRVARARAPRWPSSAPTPLGRLDRARRRGPAPGPWPRPCRGSDQRVPRDRRGIRRRRACRAACHDADCADTQCLARAVELRLGLLGDPGDERRRRPSPRSRASRPRRCRPTRRTRGSQVSTL